MLLSLLPVLYFHFCLYVNAFSDLIMVHIETVALRLEGIKCAAPYIYSFNRLYDLSAKSLSFGIVLIKIFVPLDHLTLAAYVLPFF